MFVGVSVRLADGFQTFSRWATIGEAATDRAY
jgi:hypothetical protein